MKTLNCLLLFSVLCCPTLASGETLREVELTDGSIVQAEIVSMSDGVYRLRSETLGEIEIPEQRIKAIRLLPVQAARPQTNPRPSVGQSTPALTPPVPTPSVQDLQQALMQDPKVLSKILSLQNDPLVQSILSDESTMRAIEAGDLGALLNNPKIRALLNHPTVQELGRSYGD